MAEAHAGEAGRVGSGADRVLPVAGWAWLWRDFDEVLTDGTEPEDGAGPGVAVVPEPEDAAVVAAVPKSVRGVSSDVLDSGSGSPPGLYAA
ncbi:hypothetical protein [Streptomyces sp. enrichment culture]|uniref:hypothetical protein n=1 Tax=Streptomyces sp. enrichment culture TaxID=1795815 RepID=UPI003F551562